MTKTYRLMILATLLLIAGSFQQARAQVQVVPPCLPSMTSLGSPTASPIYSGVTKNGAWVYWYCYSQAIPVTKVMYVATTPEFAKVGGRLATIAKATDPLQSLRTAGSRFTILPLSDPSLAAIVADMRATR